MAEALMRKNLRFVVVVGGGLVGGSIAKKESSFCQGQKESNPNIIIQIKSDFIQFNNGNTVNKTKITNGMKSCSKWNEILFKFVSKHNFSMNSFHSELNSTILNMGLEP